MRNPSKSAIQTRELLVKKDIDGMNEKELDEARKIIAELIAILANRRSRRFSPAKSGQQLDFRKIFRRSMPFGEYCLKAGLQNSPAEKEQANPVLRRQRFDGALQPVPDSTDLRHGRKDLRYRSCRVLNPHDQYHALPESQGHRRGH